jgi:peptidoglycan/xylan/chitin deacetylase (PgdA/CDA1 family)
MRLIADSYYGGLRAARLPSLRRRLADAGVILCYHNVVAGAAGGGCPGLHERCDRFERQMRWLDREYEVVPLREFVSRLGAGGSLRSVAALTFDDGYAGVFEHAVPILEALGMPATIFIVADAVGSGCAFPWDMDGTFRPASWTQIREAVRRGMEIGVHSATHPSLPSLSGRELEREIGWSRATIGDALGVAPQFFAYPFGHWSPRVRDAVRSAGYAAGLTLDFGLNRRGADRWSLRRVNIPSGISHAAFESWTSGIAAPSLISPR